MLAVSKEARYTSKISQGRLDCVDNYLNSDKWKSSALPKCWVSLSSVG
jgi:hypothetical protein